MSLRRLKTCCSMIPAISRTSALFSWRNTMISSRRFKNSV